MHDLFRREVSFTTPQIVEVPKLHQRHVLLLAPRPPCGKCSGGAQRP